MRLIDADVLKEDVEQQCALLRLMKDNDELTQISVVLESGFKAQIDKMPTIEKCKKGTWKPDRDNERDWYCSECDYIGNRWFKYCPNCGADMRGEKDGN